jgi:hypothetical protein
METPHFKGIKGGGGLIIAQNFCPRKTLVNDDLSQTFTSTSFDVVIQVKLAMSLGIVVTKDLFFFVTENYMSVFLKKVLQKDILYHRSPLQLLKQKLSCSNYIMCCNVSKPCIQS